MSWGWNENLVADVCRCTHDILEYWHTGHVYGSSFTRRFSTCAALVWHQYPVNFTVMLSHFSKWKHSRHYMRPLPAAAPQPEAFDWYCKWNTHYAALDSVAHLYGSRMGKCIHDTSETHVHSFWQNRFRLKAPPNPRSLIKTPHVISSMFLVRINPVRRRKRSRLTIFPSFLQLNLTTKHPDISSGCVWL